VTEKDQKESAAYVTALVQHHSFPVRFARAKNEALTCADGGYRAQRRQAHGKMFFVWAAIIGRRIRVESYHGERDEKGWDDDDDHGKRFVCDRCASQGGKPGRRKDIWRRNHG
jgi:hypothetical protein